MKFEFKPVRKTVDLGEYAEEMKGAEIRVRVNVTRATLGQMYAVKGETPLEEFFGLLAELWGEEWPVEDVRALYEHCVEQDPQLWGWVTRRTFEEVLAYQAGQKKA
jgi:hypothetical protein